VRFLGAIKEAQGVGFTLAEIAEYLRAARRSGGPSEALRVRMAAKIDQIDARIAALRRMRGELARVVGCAPRSGRETRGSSRPRPAHHFRRRLRSATASVSHDSSCG
jgi:DNA-binding transcriptional MerR regulator